MCTVSIVRLLLLKTSLSLAASLLVAFAGAAQTNSIADSNAALYRDVTRAVGQKKYQEAMVLGRKLLLSANNYEQAYSKIVQAAKAAGQLEQAEMMFDALLRMSPPNPGGYYGLGLVQSERQDYARAIESYKKCLEEKNALALPGLALVDAYRKIGKLEEAEAYFNLSLRAGTETAPARLALGYCHLKQGRIEASLKEFERASQLAPMMPEACYYQSLALYNARKYKDSLGRAEKCLPAVEAGMNIEHRQLFLNLTGASRKVIGDYAEAESIFRQALNLAREFEDKSYEEVSLGYLASILESQDEYLRALSGYQQAVGVARASLTPGSAINLRRYFGRIGRIYSAIGDFSSALQYFQTGLAISKEAGDEDLEALILNYIGDAFLAQHNISEALSCYQRAAVINQKHPTYQNPVMDNLALLYLQTGRYQQAREVIDKGLKQARELSYVERELVLLNRSGELSLRLNDGEQAIKTYGDGLRLAREKNSLLHAGTASAGLAAAHRLLKQPEQARAAYLQAVKFMEDVRARLTAEEEQAGFFNDKVKIYKDLIVVLIELHGQDGTKGYEREAFDYAERARARAFLDLLAESKVNAGQHLAPDLLEQRQRIDAAIARINAALMKERSLEPAKQNQAAIEGLEKQRGEADRDYANWLRELRRRDPQYAGPKYPEPISLEQAQQLLDEQTVMLSYSLGETSSFLFAVSRDALLTRQLDGAAKEIGQEVERLVAAIKNRSTGEFRKQSVRLYERLIQPAAELLKGKRELVIVADGALHRVPFEVLLPPSSRRITQPDLRTLPYLVQEYAISYAPSASVLAGLQDYRREATAGQKAFLAFADPVYDAEAQSKDSVVAITTRSAQGDDGQWKFNRLAFSRNEAEGIAGLFPREQAEVFQGAQATEENAKTPGRLAQYRMLHFAAHGLINPHRPRFSGIVLTLPRNNQSAANTGAEDGILQAYEIFNLKLNADLVVLSACETGLGKEVNGEGMMGLTRAFIYAGTPSVVVSLWNVDDEKSADLMIRFYTHLKDGRSKSEALRQAQLDMIKKNGAPYFWAPFILMGRAK